MRRRCKKPDAVPRTEWQKKEYLEPSDKEALYRFIEGQAYNGFAVTRPIIQLYASHLVRLRKPNYETLSDSWVHAFTHSDEFIDRFKRTHRKPLDGKRKTAQDRVNLQKWFRSYKRDIKNWRVNEDRIYNFDEGGLRVGCMRGEWVYVQPYHEPHWSEERFLLIKGKRVIHIVSFISKKMSGKAVKTRRSMDAKFWCGPAEATNRQTLPWFSPQVPSQLQAFPWI